MRARLFPATTRDTKTAFTFKVLKEFHLHNLESKKAAYDYLGAIRRLTDNAFTADVPVRFHTLLSSHLKLVSRIPTQISSVLCEFGGCSPFASVLDKRMALIVCYRIVDQETLSCTARPAQSQVSILRRDGNQHHLSLGRISTAVSTNTFADRGLGCHRHLNQSQKTLDGNFQCNKMKKNSDPDDVSLCQGNAYFPKDDLYKAYLRTVPKSEEVRRFHDASMQVFTD